MDHGYVDTRTKKRVNYQFVASREIQEINDIDPNDTLSYYYQICTFPTDPHSNTKKFHMRKFVINGDNNFLDVKEYLLTKNQCKRFYAEKKPHEFKRYDVYNLDNIGAPSLHDVSTSKSDTLNSNYDYSGYAPF